MKATCPKDGGHKRFVTTATVQEDWLVDEAGNFIESHGSVQTVHKPDPGNIWTCATCGAEAVVTQ